MSDPMIAVSEQILQSCEAERLHLSGAIQSFGAMLRIDAASLIVTHASTNLGDYLTVSAQQLLGQHISKSGCLTARDFYNLPVVVGKTVTLRSVAETPAWRVDALFIRGESCILVELEKTQALAEPIPLHHFQRMLLRSPADETQLQNHHQILLQAIRSIINFDRIMIYRFRDNWDGEVIAEATGAGLGSYLGLRFPAGDIPAIARNLYMLNPSRMIPDSRAQPVTVLSLDGVAPDLTRSDLRSVSPVHLEYLANMGVAASFSVPIRIHGVLWGLVACHHLMPNLLTPDQRNACSQLTNTYALALTTYFASCRLRMIDSLDRRIDRVLKAISLHRDPLDGLEAHAQTLMEALGAGGFAMVINEDVAIAGSGPDLECMSIIDGWFVNDCQETIVATDHLAQMVPQAKASHITASGLLAIKVVSPRKGEVRFYWFRPEESQEVAWAGNPNKPTLENAGATRLSPRRSFERWIEIKKGYSRPWTAEEKVVGTKFRNTLLRWL